MIKFLLKYLFTIATLSFLCLIPNAWAEDELETRLDLIPLEGSGPVLGGEVPAIALEHKRFIEQLISRLSSKEEEERLKAAVALRQVAEPDDVPLLVEILRKSHRAEVQIQLVQTLGELGDRRAAKALMWEIEHGKPAVRTTAILAIGKLKSDWPVSFLHALSRKTKSVSARLSIISALGNIGTDKARYSISKIGALGGMKSDSVLQRASSLALDRIDGKYPEDEADTNLPPGRKLIKNFNGMKYYFYHPGFRPKKYPKTWLLICVHGGSLNAEDLFQYCHQLGKVHRIAAVAPVFDIVRFPHYSDLGIRGERADLWLFKLVEHLSKTVDLHNHEFFMLGEGHGGEFVQRFTLAYPEKVARAIFTTNKPIEVERKQLFPEGFESTPLAPDLKFSIRGFLKTDIMIVAKSFKDDPASAFYERLKEYARGNGINHRVRLTKFGTGGRLIQLSEFAESFFFQ